MARLVTLVARDTGAAVCLQPVAKGRGHILVGEAADPEAIPGAPLAQVRLLDLAGIGRQEGGVLGLVDLPGGVSVCLALIGADLEHISASRRGLCRRRRHSGSLHWSWRAGH